MTAIMSLSNAPDEAMLGRVAGALAVDEAFVEKDWFVVQAIKVLVDHGHDEFTPVFAGGTSLLKGHGLIKRFSEDIDFKLLVPEAHLAKSDHLRRKALSAYRDELEAAWTEAGFSVTKVTPHRGNAFIQFEMDYPTRLKGHGALRPHILAEISARPPRLAPVPRPVGSFVAEYQGAAPELPEVLCIDPVETAADKLSAFTWRMIERDRSDEKDDPAIVRHLHDLAVLEPLALSSEDFAPLLRDTLGEDEDRGKGAHKAMSPRERLEAMRAELSKDALYADEYRTFVGGMAFAGETEIPGFEATLASIDRLVARYED